MSSLSGTTPQFVVTDELGSPDPPDPRLDLYLRALMALRERDRRWQSNYHRFIKWEARQQLKWIAYIEKGAVMEKPLPMARELYMMALTLRMTT